MEMEYALLKDTLIYLTCVEASGDELSAEMAGNLLNSYAAVMDVSDPAQAELYELVRGRKNEHK